jgi:hypothetical protein
VQHENVVWRGEISKRSRGSDDHTLPAILRIGHVELRAESLIWGTENLSDQ